MAKKKWSTERKWELSKQEKEFVELLNSGGFSINGIREYVSKTDYLVEKDGIEYEYDFPLSGTVNVKTYYKLFVNSFDIYKELINLRKDALCGAEKQ